MATDELFLQKKHNKNISEFVALYRGPKKKHKTNRQPRDPRIPWTEDGALQTQLIRVFQKRVVFHGPRSFFRSGFDFQRWYFYPVFSEKVFIMTVLGHGFLELIAELEILAQQPETKSFEKKFS